MRGNAALSRSSLSDNNCFVGAKAHSFVYYYYAVTLS